MTKFQISSKTIISRTLAILLTMVFCTSTLAGGQKRPQIPKHNFEWTGVFMGNQPYQGTDDDLDQPAEVEQLTVRGKWQTGEDGETYFNLYMEQGDANSDTWVENFIYGDKLYTITRKWHTDLPVIFPDGSTILGKCFQNEIYNSANPSEPLSIDVDGFNRGLASARLVGVEKVDGKPMNHFRHTCLSRVSPQFLYPFEHWDPTDENNKLAIPFKMFSDIYVPVGKSYPWAKWLQYGDGVGPDPQEDEWFLADRFYNDPDDIVLPQECKTGNEWPFLGAMTLVYAEQTTCTNLVAPETP